MYLTLSTLTLLFLGLIYAFSMFAAPMCATFGLEKADVALTFNIMMIAFCVGATIGSQLEKVIGVRWSIVLSGTLFFIGFAGTGFFAHNQLFVVYLLYGVCAGTGVGMGYNTIAATTNQWFPDKVGFSSGVLMMGFGVSALIIGNISVGFIASLGLLTVFARLASSSPWSSPSSAQPCSSVRPPTSSPSWHPSRRRGGRRRSRRQGRRA